MDMVDWRLVLVLIFFICVQSRVEIGVLKRVFFEFLQGWCFGWKLGVSIRCIYVEFLRRT